MVHRACGPFGLGIQTIDFSGGKGSAILVGPPLGEIDVMGNAAGNADVIDVPVPVSESASGRFIVLTCKDQDFSGWRSKAGGVAIGVQDGAQKEAKRYKGAKGIHGIQAGD